MKRYAYQVIVANQHKQCQNVQDVAQFVNTAMGFPLVSRYMVLNHFVRPHLACQQAPLWQREWSGSRDTNGAPADH